MFVSILTADSRYSFLNRDNLRQPIQIILSQKLKTFFQFNCAILKSMLKVEHFQKNDDPHS